MASAYRPLKAQIPMRREMRARAAITILAQFNPEAQESTSLPARPMTSEALWASRNAYSTMVWPGSENTGGGCLGFDESVRAGIGRVNTPHSAVDRISRVAARNRSRSSMRSIETAGTSMRPWSLMASLTTSVFRPNQRVLGSRSEG